MDYNTKRKVASNSLLTKTQHNKSQSKDKADMFDEPINFIKHSAKYQKTNYLRVMTNSLFVNKTDVFTLRVTQVFSNFWAQSASSFVVDFLECHVIRFIRNIVKQS